MKEGGVEKEAADVSNNNDNNNFSRAPFHILGAGSPTATGVAHGIVVGMSVLLASTCHRC